MKTVSEYRVFHAKYMIEQTKENVKINKKTKNLINQINEINQKKEIENFSNGEVTSTFKIDNSTLFTCNINSRTNL